MQKRVLFFSFLISSLVLSRGMASTVSIQGRILKPDGHVLETSGVTFRVRILAANANNCILYEESQIKDMTSSGGLFTLSLNDGTGSRSDGLGHTFEQVFSNQNSFSVPSTLCGSGSGTVTYTPASTDERQVIVYFKEPGATSWEQMPVMKLSHVGRAIEAQTASSVGSFGSQSLCRIVDGSGNPYSVSALTNTQWTQLLSLISGSSTSYMSSSTAAGATLPSSATTPVSAAEGSVWYDSATGQIKYKNGSGVQTLGTSTSSTTLAGYGITDAVQNGGQAGAVTVGTSDATALTLKTNNSSVVTVSSAGKVGIGTALPNAKFVVTDGTDPQASTLGVNPLISAQASGPAYIMGKDLTNGIEFMFGTSNLGVAWVGSTTAHNLQLRTTNATRMTLDTSGNVGIGITTPATTLDVRGTAYFYKNYGGSYPAFGTTMGTGGLAIGWNGSSSLLGETDFINFPGGGSGGFSFLLANSSGNITGNPMVIRSSGNVGIGTPTPGSRLSVLGATADSTAASMSIANSVGTSMFYIRNDGKIGLGTTAPASRLHLAMAPTATANSPLLALGSAPFDGSTSGFFVGNSNGTILGANAVSGYSGDFLNFQVAGSSKFKIDSTGNITSSGTTTASGNYTSTGNIATTGNISTTGTGTITSGGAMINNSTTASTSPTTGALIVSGGTGIGGALNVSSNITTNGNLVSSASTSATGSNNYSSPSFGLSGNYWTGSATAADQWSIQNILGTGANPTSTLQFSHTGSSATARYALMNGNVGIGTTTASAALDISSGNFGIIVGADSSATTRTDATAKMARIGMPHYTNAQAPMALLVGLSNSSTNELRVGGGSSAFNAATHLEFYTGANSTTTSGTERMRIDSVGNVGIGTSSPTNIFHLAKDTSSEGTLLQLDGFSASQNVLGGIVVRGARGTKAAPSAVQSGDVIDIMAARAYGATQFATASTANVAAVATQNMTDSAMGTALRFNTTPNGGVTSTERVRIDQNGNVGIGTTAPNATLQVNGTITGKPAVSNGTSTVDFGTGNLQYTTSSCGAFNLNNMKDGSSYAFAVQGATAGTCSFNAYSDVGVTALTVHMPPNHGISTASTHTLYNFMVLGTHVYVSWTPGY